MKLNIISLVLFIGALLAGAAVSAETIYTWTDENGVRHMTNISPVQSPDKLDVIELEPAPLPEEPAIQYTLPEAPTGSEAETEITIIDNHVIVPVLLSYKGRQVKARPGCCWTPAQQT